MSDGALRDGEQVVRIVAQTAVDNEKYFGELDAVVGDGDLGYSLARGFSKLLEGWDEMDYEDLGGLLKKTALVLSGRIGGTSGPIWGTAFLRAGMTAGSDATIDGAKLVEMLRAAIEGIKARGKSDVGDKTLLDALVPLTDTLEQELQGGADGSKALAAAATTAKEAAEATKNLIAKRGRASYTGERSIGSVDAGATAIGVITEKVSEAWNQEAGS